MQTIPDSNVVLDIISRQPSWFQWSLRWFDRARMDGPLIMNPITFAEATARIPKWEPAFAMLKDFGLSYEDVPIESAYLAGRAHQSYRNHGGVRERVLPDFLVGAHAFIKGYRLLTRDANRYRSYFPDVEIIAPDTHP